MKIILPGEPIAQARMKHSRRGSFVNTYDPKAKDKENIRWQLTAMKTSETFNHPRLSFLFHMPIPKSVPKRDLPLYLSGRLKHEKKPDEDNLVKLYQDCLDGIIIHGDQKVSLGSVVKVYHPEPKTIIWVNETTQTLQPWELDFAFLDASEPDIPPFSEKDSLDGFCTLWIQVRRLFAGGSNPSCATQPSA